MADETLPPSRQFWRAPTGPTSADQVLNVMDFEALARDALPPAHFGYIATGVDDDRTVIRNHEAFSHYEIRARRFNDLSHLTTSLSVFGVSWPSPIYLSAVSAQRAFHAEAELATARAARKRSMQLMLSNGSSTATEAVGEARGAPIWQQLYPTDDWSVATGIVRRAENAGCTAIVLTVDSPGARNLETLSRATQVDSRDWASCDAAKSRALWQRGPIYAVQPRWASADRRCGGWRRSVNRGSRR